MLGSLGLEAYIYGDHLRSSHSEFLNMALSLESLEVLDAIERKGSFAAAAHEMGKVPSALTYVVRKLEEDLDVLLFDRRRHRAELTPAGRALLDEGRHLLHAADDLARRVKRLATGWEATLTIVVDDLINFRALLPVIHDFYAENTATRLRFSKEVLGGAWDALVSNRADLVIGGAYDAPSTQGFQIRPLGSMPFVFAVAAHHPLATEEGPLTTIQIARHRIVAVGDTSRNLPARTHGVLAGQDVLVVPTMRDKLEAQIRGLGCGWLPAPMAQPHIESGVLQARETVEVRAPGNFKVAWRTSNRGKALQWWASKLEDPRLAQALLQQPDFAG
ncbi:transcriptional regulator LysR family [Cupriavidus necator N-1]|uniref:Transcriptional regulator LysR family n=2 Tax=Burkholderiaceae TaxID=119060 RepID=G0ESB9_CUPNN|nr:transcriptional regulator LysR family [Cupriavidus necator N-1]